MIYKIKQVSIEPDQYGNNLVVKMITKYDDNGKYIKHIKLDQDAKVILETGVLIPEESLKKREE